MLAFILPLLSNLTLAQVLEELPEIIKIIQAGIAIYNDLSNNGGLQKDEASVQAAGLVGKAVVKLVADTVGAVIPLPHKMTPEEEQLWFSRAQGDN